MTSESLVSHGHEIFDRRCAHVDNAVEEGKQLPGGLKSERHLVDVVKDYDRQAAEMRKPRNTSTVSTINGPFVHNLPTVYRQVFTVKGIQSTHGVTHRIEEGKVYNNVYPDANEYGFGTFVSLVLSVLVCSYAEILVSLRKKE